MVSWWPTTSSAVLRQPGQPGPLVLPTAGGVAGRGSHNLIIMSRAADHIPAPILICKVIVA